MSSDEIILKTTAKTLERVRLKAKHAKEGLGLARKHLAEKTLAGDTDSVHLVDSLHNLAGAEVEDQFWSTAHAVLEEGRIDLAGFVAWKTKEALSTGLDDTWSGRRNEVRRVKFNALLQILDKVAFLVAEEAKEQEAIAEAVKVGLAAGADS